MAYKGKFSPQNPKKFKGDYTKIIYRSGWELKFMNYLDRQPEVISWSSEEVIIPYKSPIDNRFHRYYPDFWVKTLKGESLIEIKPKRQTQPPKENPKHRRRYLKEVKTWGINSAKFAAAEQFCKSKGWEWRIITDDVFKLTK